jgi:hypothetical protein
MARTNLMARLSLSANDLPLWSGCTRSSKPLRRTGFTINPLRRLFVDQERVSQDDSPRAVRRPGSRRTYEPPCLAVTRCGRLAATPLRLMRAYTDAGSRRHPHRRSAFSRAIDFAAFWDALPAILWSKQTLCASCVSGRQAGPAGSAQTAVRAGQPLPSQPGHPIRPIKG